jgi:hypothetical protein
LLPASVIDTSHTSYFDVLQDNLKLCVGGAKRPSVENILANALISRFDLAIVAVFDYIVSSTTL